MLERQEQISGNDMLAVWKARLDEIATRLMVEGSGSGTIDDLRAIGAELQQHGQSAGLEVLNGLIARLDGDLEAGTTHLLKSGIAELQASLTSSQDEPAVKAAPVSLAEDPELVADFLVEAREHLSQIEGQMLVLERDPESLEVIHAVFRAFHTIKGLAGFLDFSKVQALAHEVETLLDLARNQKLVIDSAVVDVVLESGDALQSDLTAIELTLNKGVPLDMVDDRALIAKIRNIVSPGSAVPDSEPLAATPAPSDAKGEKAGKASSPRSSKPKKQKAAAEAKVVKEEPAAKPAPAVTPASAPSPVAKAEPAVASAPVAKPAAPAVKPAPAPAAAPVVVKASQVREEPVRPAKPEPQQAKEQTGAKEQASLKEERRSSDASSVRVETSKLDHLMDMVGEIVIAQSLIRHNGLLSSISDSRLLGDLSQLARVTIEVQRATMSMRMVPMGQLFQRIERVIRDLSRKAGKQVILETSGNDTEIDKTVAEELSDPLLHMVRNSVDHGVESLAERVAAGKTPEARIRLSAYHQGGQVMIEISDDGRGLNSEKIRAKAADRGLISHDAQLTDAEIYQLIFEPGFSTAEKITDVSGRGVGMDVVRRNVEKLRGRIETQSTLGQGTTFLLKLPLTLAIIDGLVIEVGTERYIIPLAGVREIFRPQPDALFTVEGKDEMLLVRGKLVPVVRLHERFNIEGRAKQPSEGLIVVLESQDRNFCLLVDDLLGKQEVVIKSLGEAFKDISGLSGCAVLGDGRVGLILDVDGICRGKR
jgi:two-component system chemotaxis sensor kinase CheA